jgi:hypothetical protein
MADKRNIVIKVNYPVSEKGTRHLAPKMITEWNVKRIALVAGALVLVLAALIYVINKEPKKVDSVNVPVPVSVNATEQQVSPEIKDKEAEVITPELPVQPINEIVPSKKPKKDSSKAKNQTARAEPVKKQPNKKISKEHEHSHVVSRSLLTYGIKNKEPGAEIAGFLKVSGKKSTWVYYFTELKSMKGSRVYHEWLKNGSHVSRQSIVISGDTWRTSSRKLMSESDKGKWTVRMVDESNRSLDEKTFKVE